jgi:hypothetical protein
MSRIKKLKAALRKRDDIIASFISRDFRQQGIDFEIDDEYGYLFPTVEDIKQSIARAKEMGYDKWLYGDEEPKILETN